MANNGFYTWSINDPTIINKILNANIDDLFESPIFKIANLEWQIQLFPNGTMDSNNKGQCSVFIKLVNMPGHWRRTAVTQTIECLNTLASNTYTYTYKDTQDTPGWRSQSLLLSELRNLGSDRITFRISLQIQYIIASAKRLIYYDIKPIPENKFYIQWPLDKQMINAFKTAHNGKLFESPNIGNKDLFILQCYPNGVDGRFNGKMSLYLKLTQLAIPFANRIKVKYKIFIGKISFAEKDKKFDMKDFLFWGNAQFSTLDKVLNQKVTANQNHPFNLKKQKSKSISLKRGKTVQLSEFNEIYINAEITIERIYDKNGLKIDKKKWNDHKYMYEYNKNILFTQANGNPLHPEVSIQTATDTHSNIEEKYDNHTNFPQPGTITTIRQIPQTIDDHDDAIFLEGIMNDMPEQEKNKLQSLLTKSDSQNNISTLNTKDLTKYFANNNFEGDNVPPPPPPPLPPLPQQSITEEVFGDLPNEEGTNDIDNEVANWLTDDKICAKYIETFIDEGYEDFEVIMTLSEMDLVEMGIAKKGHRKKIMLKIEKLKQEYNKAVDGHVPTDSGIIMDFAEGLNVVVTGGK